MVREPQPLDTLAKENSVLELYSLATRVQILMNHNAEGFITGISIRNGGYVQYEVSFFNNGEYKSIWLQDFEFTTEGEKYKIGFK